MNILERIKSYDDKQMAEFIIMVGEKALKNPKAYENKNILQMHIEWVNQEFVEEEKEIK
jgi:hypothetical protein